MRYEIQEIDFRPEVKKLLKLTSSFSDLDYSVPMARYSGKPFERIIGGLSFLDIQFLKTTDVKEYSPNNQSWPESLQKTKDTTNTDNTQKIEVFTSLHSVSCENFESFLAKCKQKTLQSF
ncbi:hypothetical protein [Psychroserpens sp.]|uniref:hypothetical protein n=1 Tax=Psychroserpens sp. TaxID=2020870 RepID=UPI0039E4731D